MTGRNLMTVLLHVPDRIRRGLDSGAYKAFGGTVRNLQGSIVALLEGGQRLAELTRDGSSLDPKALLDAIGHAQTAAQLASGIGAMNLAVNVAGFAIMKRDLDRIAGQLRTLTAGLNELREEAAWIGGLQMAVIRGDIDTALDMAERARRQRNLLLFTDAKGAAFKVRLRLHHTLEMMLDTRRALRRHRVFGELMQASAVLALMEAQCDNAVEGPDAALEALGEATRKLRDLSSAFGAQRSDFASDPKFLLELGQEGRRKTAEMQSGLLTIHQQLEGLSGRLMIQSAAGMTSDEWQAMASPEGSGVMTCLAVPEGARAELLDWVKWHADARDRPGEER